MGGNSKKGGNKAPENNPIEKSGPTGPLSIVTGPLSIGLYNPDYPII